MTVRLHKSITAGAIAIASMTVPPALAQDYAVPPLVKQINNGNWLPQSEAEALRDELFYQRAIFAYQTMLPALNTIGMRDGSETLFGKGYNVLPIWKDRMDARTWVPTPNADVIYSMNYLDLKETGPLVVAAPPNVIGMFTDFFQRTITDVGLIGPDRARGGLYLLLPPDYDGQVPQGYFAFKSKTYNVFLFFRTIMAKGDNGPDPKPAVALAEQTRVYPLWTPEKDVKPMQFPNGSGKRINMMYPTDKEFWTKLKAFVDYEPISAIDPELRGVLASIGIIKRQSFNPTAKQQELLQRAVETAPKMILALRQLGRPDDRQLYLQGQTVSKHMGGRHGGVAAGQLSRRESTDELLPDCLLVGARNGYADTGRWVQVSVHDQGCQRRIPQRLEHLQAPPAAQSASEAVLGRYRLQHHRRHDGGSTATVAVDQWLQQGRHERRRLGRSLVRPVEVSGRAGFELHPNCQRTEFSRGVAALRHRGRVLRPDLEAG
jgi:hypothetical protein